MKYKTEEGAITRQAFEIQAELDAVLARMAEDDGTISIVELSNLDRKRIALEAELKTAAENEQGRAGMTTTNQHPPEIRNLIAGALAAEEHNSLDELEAFAAKQRTKAFAEPGEDSIIDTINPATGLSAIEGENLEQIRLRYPTAEIVDYENWVAAKGERQHAPGQWLPSTEEQYWNMLEVLPPADMLNGGFLVGEPMEHSATTGSAMFEAYRERAGKVFEVYSRPMTRKEFRAELAK